MVSERADGWMKVEAPGFDGLIVKTFLLFTTFTAGIVLVPGAEDLRVVHSVCLCVQ